MRGRKPKPLGTREQEGDTRKIGVRKLRERIAAEPHAQRGLPDCPEYLKGIAREAWMFWAEELTGMGLDHRPDSHMLEGACVAYETAVYCYELVTKHGRFIPKRVTDAKGNLTTVGLTANPAVAMGSRAWETMKGFCSEFGLSPVSRTRLSIERKDSSDDLAKLLMQPRAPRSDKQPGTVQ